MPHSTVPTVRSRPPFRSGITALHADVACSHVERAETGSCGQPGGPFPRPFRRFPACATAFFSLAATAFFTLPPLRLSAGEATHPKLHPRPLDKALPFWSSFVPVAFAAFRQRLCIALDSLSRQRRDDQAVRKNLPPRPNTRAGIRPLRAPSLATVNPSVRSPWADARCWPAGMLPASGRLFFWSQAAWGRRQTDEV